MKVFIDTSIPMYAAGKEHRFKAACVDILDAVVRKTLEAYTDTEVFQETLYRYFNIGRREIGLQVFDLFSTIMNGSVLPVRHKDMVQARLLSENEETSGLSPRDLVHLAVMLNNGIDTIFTTDRGFEKVSGIKVVTPGK